MGNRRAAENAGDPQLIAAGNKNAGGIVHLFQQQFIIAITALMDLGEQRPLGAQVQEQIIDAE